MLVKVPRGKARHYSKGCGVTAPRKPKSLTDANVRLDKGLSKILPGRLQISAGGRAVGEAWAWC